MQLRILHHLLGRSNSSGRGRSGCRGGSTSARKIFKLHFLVTPCSIIYKHKPFSARRSTFRKVIYSLVSHFNVFMFLLSLSPIPRHGFFFGSFVLFGFSFPPYAKCHFLCSIGAHSFCHCLLV